jgi:hypothetical protein
MVRTSYLPPRWLPSGHLQTIYPALFLKQPQTALRRERWRTPDDDFIDVDFIDGLPGKPFVIMFHGLEGSSNSHYARAMFAELSARGWSGAMPHFRGCSGEPNTAPRFYHSGDAQEIDWLVHTLHQQTYQPGNYSALYACGVSLGGNALLRWLGTMPERAHIIDAACAISAPLDLAAGGATLSKGINLLYTRHFLQTLKPKCLNKLKQYPGLFDRDAMLAATNLYEFDNVVTAPLHGYKNTDDYWHRASAKYILPHIQIKTLILNAKNDPFLPAHYLPTNASSAVTLDYPEHGGHVGFVTGNLPGQLAWLPKKVLHFFTTVNL